MRLFLTIGILSVLSFAPTGCSKAKAPAEEIKPPVAKVVPKELTAHGHTRIDNYYWLNQRDDPEVIAYLEAENAYKKEVYDKSDILRCTAVLDDSCCA